MRIIFETKHHFKLAKGNVHCNRHHQQGRHMPRSSTVVHCHKSILDNFVRCMRFILNHIKQCNLKMSIQIILSPHQCLKLESISYIFLLRQLIVFNMFPLNQSSYSKSQFRRRIAERKPLGHNIFLGLLWPNIP